jgi:hypothetical protein
MQLMHGLCCFDFFSDKPLSPAPCAHNCSIHSYLRKEGTFVQKSPPQQEHSLLAGTNYKTKNKAGGLGQKICPL